jgi:hypothetical protein
MIVLSIPYKRVHPGIKDGSLKSEAIEKLDHWQSKRKVKKKR